MTAQQGIPREQIETMLRAHVIRFTGFPADSVFFSEYAVDTAACPLPCVSMTLLPYSDLQREGSVFLVDSLEFWRLTITTATSLAIYYIDILGVTYSYIATPTDTVSDIRSGLLGAINAGVHPDFVAVTAGTASIDIESQSPGLRLRCATASPREILEYLRGNALKVTTRAVSLPVTIECVGVFSSPPTVHTTGVDIAERLMYRLLDPDEMADMVDAGHCIGEVVCEDVRRVLDGKAETSGIITATLNTTSYNYSNANRADDAPLTFTPEYA